MVNLINSHNQNISRFYEWFILLKKLLEICIFGKPREFPHTPAASFEAVRAKGLRRQGEGTVGAKDLYQEGMNSFNKDPGNWW